MALKLRLARGGSKKRPYYKIVVADARSPRDGRFIEQIGHYNPMLPKDSGERVGLNEDRIKHWLDNGAQPTDRVLRFLDEAGLAKRAQPNNPKKGEPGQKAKERAEERAAKLAEAAEAAKEAAASAAESASETAENAAESAAETAGDAAEAASETASSVAETVADAAGAVAETVADVASSAIDAVKGAVTGDSDKKDDEKAK